MLKYFKKRKEEKLLQKRIQHEVLETLCTICLVIYYDRNICRGSVEYKRFMQTHFYILKQRSETLRKELEEMESKMEPPAKKDLSIKLSQAEKIEIDKSLGEYKPEPKKIAGWGFSWK